jgi:hypothetical protein
VCRAIIRTRWRRYVKRHRRPPSAANERDKIFKNCTAIRNAPLLSNQGLLRSGVPRKATPTNRSTNPERPRFTAEDIVRAIDGVEKAGLQIDGVEITVTGDIKITIRRSRGEKSGAASDTTTADTQAHEKSVKK